jgi:hypothetical protein
MAADEKNPWEPELIPAPLRFTFDARSFADLDGEELEQAQFLCGLCSTPAVEALFTWGAPPIDASIPQTKLLPVERDCGAVGMVGDDHGFINILPVWSQYERIADDYGYQGEEREWFMFYGPAVRFHKRQGSGKSHYFVTADESVLDQVRGEVRGPFSGSKERICSIRSALYHAGMAMKAANRIYYQVDPRPLHTNNFTVYFYLMPDLVRSRGRLAFHWKGQGLPGQGMRPSELEATVQSIDDRSTDLLKARDWIALQNMRPQNNATLDDILYHLRAAIGSAAALFDSIAVLAHLTRPEELAVGDVMKISLRRSGYLQRLRNAGLAGLAEQAAEHQTLFDFLWSLRNPVLHRSGLGGHIYADATIGLDAASSRVSLTEEQTLKLKLHGDKTGSSPEFWGMEENGLGASIEPHAFSNRLALESIETAEALGDRLADDVGAPPWAWPDADQDKIRRFRWLSGIRLGELALPRASR